MSMEISRAAKSLETPAEPERTRVVEEIFKKFNAYLLKKCRGEIEERSPQPEIDGEEIVQQLYANLLDPLIEIPRTESRMKGFLDAFLALEIDEFFLKHATKEPKSKKGVISLDKILTGNAEDQGERGRDLKTRIAIDNALAKLGLYNKQWADIITKHYIDGQTDEEIAIEYGETAQNIQSMRQTAEKKLGEIMVENELFNRTG